MSYERIIKMANTQDVYRLAIIANFEDMTYSLAVVEANHTHSSIHYHRIATFYNIQEATHEYHNRVTQETQESLKKLYEEHNRGLLM